MRHESTINRQINRAQLTRIYSSNGRGKGRAGLRASSRHGSSSHFLWDLLSQRKAPGRASTARVKRMLGHLVYLVGEIDCGRARPAGKARHVGGDELARLKGYPRNLRNRKDGPAQPYVARLPPVPHAYTLRRDHPSNQTDEPLRMREHVRRPGRPAHS